MSINIRFRGLVDTTVNLNADRFLGRIAFDTTLNRSVVCYDGTNWAQNARRTCWRRSRRVSRTRP